MYEYSFFSLFQTTGGSGALKTALFEEGDVKIKVIKFKIIIRTNITFFMNTQNNFL